jgi:hypothetical protein
MEPRTPDFSYQDQLLNRAYDQDEELQRIIIQSRQEYMENEKARKKIEKKKNELQKLLAVPIARMTLWRNTTNNTEEKECLRHILNILYIKTHVDRDDDDIYIPEESKEDLKNFLEKYTKQSHLYRNVYDVCLEYME